MYDTINFKVTFDTSKDLEKFMSKFDSCRYTTDKEDRHSFNASFHNYKVFGQGTTAFFKGSIAKYFYGNNISTLGRSDTQKAVCKLVSELDLEGIKEQVFVTRIDFGLNIKTKKEVFNYFPCIDYLDKYRKSNHQTTILFQKTNTEVCLYDKGIEIKHKDKELYNTLPNFLVNNILRIELRFLQRLRQSFNMDIHLQDLYDEFFYLEVFERFKSITENIRYKENELQGLESVSTKKDLIEFALENLIKTYSLDSLLSQMENCYKSGHITRLVYYRLKADLKKFSKRLNEIDTSEDIIELKTKIQDSVKNFR